ncbi:hypothetical protein [Dysgonomonas sp. 520]|nr:hypothetical protein [Dysgonomonas sp. 520]
MEFNIAIIGEGAPGYNAAEKIIIYYVLYSILTNNLMAYMLISEIIKIS